MTLTDEIVELLWVLNERYFRYNNRLMMIGDASNRNYEINCGDNLQFTLRQSLRKNSSEWLFIEIFHERWNCSFSFIDGDFDISLISAKSHIRNLNISDPSLLGQFIVMMKLMDTVDD